MHRTTTLRSQRYMSCARTREHRASDIFGAQHLLMRVHFDANFSRKDTESCNVLHIRDQFHQRVYVQLFCVQILKAQKAAWVDCLFWAFGICSRKSCRYNVSEIDSRGQFHQPTGAKHKSAVFFNRFVNLIFVNLFFWKLRFRRYFFSK